MTKKLPYYPKLVRLFYNNLEIHEGVIFSEVNKIPIVVDQSLFYSLFRSLGYYLFVWMQNLPASAPGRQVNN